MNKFNKTLALIFIFLVGLLIFPKKSFAIQFFKASNISYNPSNELLTFTAQNQYDNGSNWNLNYGTTNISIWNATRNIQYGYGYEPNYNSGSCHFINGIMNCSLSLPYFTNPMTLTNPLGSTAMIIDLWDQDQDSLSQSFTYSSILPINNDLPPKIGVISVNNSTIKVNNSITATANFTNSNSNDTDTAEWNWGDGITSNGLISELNGMDTVTNTHTYSLPEFILLN